MPMLIVYTMSKYECIVCLLTLCNIHNHGLLLIVYLSFREFMYLCVCVCVCVCVCARARTCVCVHAHAHVCLHSCLHMFVHVLLYSSLINLTHFRGLKCVQFCSLIDYLCLFLLCRFLQRMVEQEQRQLQSLR